MDASSKEKDRITSLMKCVLHIICSQALNDSEPQARKNIIDNFILIHHGFCKGDLLLIIEQVVEVKILLPSGNREVCWKTMYGDIERENSPLFTIHPECDNNKYRSSETCAKHPYEYRLPPQSASGPEYSTKNIKRPERFFEDLIEVANLTKQYEMTWKQIKLIHHAISLTKDQNRKFGKTHRRTQATMGDASISSTVQNESLESCDRTNLPSVSPIGGSRLTSALRDLNSKYPNDKLKLVSKNNELWFKCHDCPAQLYKVSQSGSRVQYIRCHIESAAHADRVKSRVTRNGETTITTRCFQLRKERLEQIRGKDTLSSRWIWWLDENQAPKPRNGTVANVKTQNGILAKKSTVAGPSMTPKSPEELTGDINSDGARAVTANKRAYMESETSRSSNKRTRLPNERIVNLEKDTTDITRLVEENKVSGESIRKFMLNSRSTSDQITQLRKEVQSYDSKLGAVSVALDNRRLQQLKEHTELIEEKMSHAQTDFDNMATRFAAELSDIAIQAAESEIIGKNSSRDHQIDDLIQSIRPIMLRLAGLESTEKQSDEMVMMRLVALEKNEKQSDDMIMLRLASLEEKNERHVSRILGTMNRPYSTSRSFPRVTRVKRAGSTDSSDEEIAIAARGTDVTFKSEPSDKTISVNIQTAQMTCELCRKQNKSCTHVGDATLRVLNQGQTTNTYNQNTSIRSSELGNDTISVDNNSIPSPAASLGSTLNSGSQQITQKKSALQEHTKSLRGMDASSNLILDQSCKTQGVPNWEKVRVKVESLGIDYPDDLPYILTYKHRALSLRCQECLNDLNLRGGVGNIGNHANSRLHALYVDRRLRDLEAQGFQRNLNEKVRERIAHFGIQSGSRRKHAKAFHGRKISTQERSKLKFYSNLADESGSEYEPFESKRQRVTDAFSPKLASDSLQSDVGRSNEALMRSKVGRLEDEIDEVKKTMTSVRQSVLEKISNSERGLQEPKVSQSQSQPHTDRVVILQEMVNTLMAKVSNLAGLVEKHELPTSHSSTANDATLIEDLKKSKGTIMKRPATFEESLAALEEQNDRLVSKIKELERRDDMRKYEE
ncbi:hypothetical protein BPAE_0207g00130 [Botrytis paeoniae]|uniref:Uncharacterized protein n=1 Tax=Botrytis paeoniae TaxID=278948 RepID=A0A4Z1FEB0_9HELO|nr:hypothetical protein BPAE_0207g00130 [Botrytis paeoniae]